MSSRIVLITGCSTGIGRALTEACVARGDTVIATARRLESLSDLQHERIKRFALDVNDASAIASLVRELEQQIDHIDLLINNAGYAAMGPVVELSRETLLRQFDTNVFAPVEVTRQLLPLLERSTKAQVVNVGSVSGILTTPFSGAYCATKAALHSLSDAMRMELAPFGIEVVVVQPGAIRSSFGDTSLAGVSDLLADDSRYKKVEKNIQDRAVASQQNPTTAEDFSTQLLDSLAGKHGPVIRVGKGSTALPMMKRWLPLSLLDKILSKKFGLKALKQTRR